MKPEATPTESYNITLPIPLKKDLLDLRERVDKAGVDFTKTLVDGLTEFVEDAKAWLKESGKARGKGQDKPSSEVVESNGRAYSPTDG